MSFPPLSHDPDTCRETVVNPHVQMRSPSTGVERRCHLGCSCESRSQALGTRSRDRARAIAVCLRRIPPLHRPARAGVCAGMYAPVRRAIMRGFRGCSLPSAIRLLHGARSRHRETREQVCFGGPGGPHMLCNCCLLVYQVQILSHFILTWSQHSNPDPST